MSSEISILELAHLAYVSDRIDSLRATEKRLKEKVTKTYPRGLTRVETEAGVLLVDIPLGEDASQVSVRYEDG